MSAGAAPLTDRRGRRRSPRVHKDNSLFGWFGQFLVQELSPYPGRASLVARIVCAVTLTMLVIETFHLPSGILGVYYSMVIARDSLQDTARRTWLVIAFFGLSTAYVLFTIAFSVDSPVTHFLWVVISCYVIFFVMAAARNYQLATGFAFLIASAIPIWDRPGDVNLKVGLTLYTLLSVVIGSLSTLVVEYIYRAFSPEDPVLRGIADRLHVSATALRAFAERKVPQHSAAARLVQYAMVGPSILRQSVVRTGQSAEVRARATAIVHMAAHVVELCATALPSANRPTTPTPEERHRSLHAAHQLERLAHSIGSFRDIRQIGLSRLPVWHGPETQAPTLTALPRIEHTTRAMIEIADSVALELDPALTARPKRLTPKEQVRGIAQEFGYLVGLRPSHLLVADAFSNPQYRIFALRGCFAATICYMIYSGLDWQGINTALITCIVTALGTIGSSRQKQVLKMAGTIVGGFVIALPAQVLLLPQMSSITSFTVFFATVTAFAAWISTSSPRLSYAGLQLAFAFFLVNVQESYEQISITAARDRVVGTMLGLTAMWLVFDRIQAPSASVQMNRLLKINLQLLAELSTLVGDARRRHTAETTAGFRALRDRISDTFTQTNAQADAVQFEWGPKRARKLRDRQRMLAMQPAMRALFLMECTLYAAELLPAHAQPTFDEEATERFKTFLACSKEALLAVADGEEARTAGAIESARAAQAGIAGATLKNLLANMLNNLTELERAAKNTQKA